MSVSLGCRILQTPTSHENKHTEGGRKVSKIFTSRHRHLTQQLGSSAVQTTEPANLISSMMEYMHLLLNTKIRIQSSESGKVSLHSFQSIQED